MSAAGGFFERLEAALRDRAVTAHVLGSGTGRLLITELGARALACRLAELDENVFFHDPAMEQAATFQGIAGGDRLWIAPEVAYY